MAAMQTISLGKDLKKHKMIFFTKVKFGQICFIQRFGQAPSTPHYFSIFLKVPSSGFLTTGNWKLLQETFIHV
jgi:hypothetical protein